MERKERRAATRIEVPLAGTVTFEAEGEGPKTIEVVAKDVSFAGAYLWAGAPKVFPRVGDKISINLRGPSELVEFQFSVKAVGTVVRVDLPQESEHGLAIKFAQIPEYGSG